MVNISKEEAQAVLDALEIGRQAAILEASNYHEAMKGYRQHTHDDLDLEVAKVNEAIAIMQAAIDAPLQERNYCQRCGKRSGCDAEHIHTCTPPAPAPQARELSDDEIRAIYKKLWPGGPNILPFDIEFARAVLATRGAA